MSAPSSTQPFGLWPSPINSAFLAYRLRFDDVEWSGDGQHLIWVEGRPNGQGVLVSAPIGGAPRDLTIEQWVRGGVGYGGGEFTVWKDQIIFTEKQGCLYRCGLHHQAPQPLTPAFGFAASPVISPDGQWVVYIWTDHQTDLLALVDREGHLWPMKLVQGADFYMQPAWHPSGQMLAWIEWYHPNMPWEATWLKIGTLEGTPPHLISEEPLAGDGSLTVTHPLFSPDGRFLTYIINQGDWDQLILLDLQTRQRRILVEGDGVLLRYPAWVQGMRSVGWSPNGQRLYYLRNYGGQATLWWVDIDQGQSHPIDTAPYTWLAQLAVSPRRDELAVLASAPDIPDRILRWDGERWHIVAHSDSEHLPPEYLPRPQHLSWQAEDGLIVHAWYYPPTHPHVRGEGLPPAIVNVHGGPTSVAYVRYNPEIAYFTSRGYAWVELNYRGSSGYGRTYQDALRGRWGVSDVEDAVALANLLEEQGLADGKRLVIRGSSAGGYTVLNVLARYPERYRAGLCLYGVSNPFTLAMETHKFESHYTDTLVGPLPQAAQIYRERSPIYYATQIQRPLAVFQGAEDRVVPPNQSETIVEALRRRGIPCIYRLYPGEGHGFRKAETLTDYLQTVEAFLKEHVLFSI
ncbi:S9 family peptidase [Thermanaerothrix sp. 4228-RoL]|uniref:S9 family peptidase n=1 Tax=Thermanaerothrix solaris TaxID=3058434 RepID=A0ABU3NLR4_9CHLR|nr:S9 family peptidase [Thermanaerothrix sp. 4228-RoL]MDT8897776.1 S9 family peptidase [Thermanaerothrix sp. 4228-RoL]